MNKMRRSLLLAIAILMVFGLQVLIAEGQQEGSATSAEAIAAWPTRDVDVYIPNPPGSPLDLGVRIMLDYLSETTGQTFVPINETTGVGTLALQKLSNSKPDGYTIMFTGSGSNIQYHTGQVSISTVNEDQATIISSSPGMKVDFDSVLVTTPDHPYQTWEEFVDYVNANPGVVKFGTATGSTVEVKARMILDHFNLSDKVKFVYAPGSEIPIGILGGSIDATVQSGHSAMPYLEDGSYRGLLHTMVSYEGSNPLLKDLPTYGDIGCPELYAYFPMYIIGPGNMDPALVEKINSVIAGAADSQDQVDRWNKMFTAFVPKKPDVIRAEVVKMDANIESVYKK